MSRAHSNAPVGSRWQQFLLAPAGPSEQGMDRGWVVISLAIGATTLVSTWSLYSTTLDVLNVIAGTVACLSLAARRTRPLAVATVTISALAVSTMAAPSAILALANVALFCRPRTYVVVAICTLAAVGVNAAVYPSHGSFLAALPTRLLLAAVAIGMGVLARAQRHKLESEQQRRMDQARTAERTRIAREMHDVLAHRISLLSVHAGALEFHPDASPDEVAHAAGVIRESAHAALGELREVIGLLREPADTDPGGALPQGAPERPQPTLGDLPRLVDESRQAGMSVALDLRLDRPDTVPDSTARAAYRVVQEGLTNARKHAPASAVEVAVAVARDTELTVSVLNHPAVNGGAPVGDADPNAAPALSLPGAGTGLAGLAERVTLAGGTLTHAPTADGGYTLRATLPLPA